MRHSRPAALGAAALAAALVASLTATGASPAQAATTVSVTSKSIDVTVGPAGDRKVCTVVYDLYRPSTATREHRKPAILTTNGFGGSKDDQADLGRAFARRGLRRAVLLRPGLRRLGLQDHPRRPRLGRPGSQAARDLPRRGQAGRRRQPGHVRPPRPGRARRPAPEARPARRHGRRLVRRPGAVRRRRHRPARRHDRPDHHLERPLLLAGAQQHGLHRPGRAGRHATARRAARRSAGPRCSSASASPTASSTRRPTRPATSAAPTSPTRPASPRRRWTRSATRPRTPSTSPGTPVGLVVRRPDPDPDAARAGAERHPVQPAGGGRHLPRAAGPGHAGEDDLAVVGPQRRRRPGAGRARHGAPARQLRGPPDHRLVRPLPQGPHGRHRPASSRYFRDWVAYDGIATPAYGTVVDVPGRHHPATSTCPAPTPS